ncbi:hypothetical protein BCR37DRAFT_383423 [Protomyces lactucae-debilis]|uniref:Uncharacterized protein n=1 Tax=Protomyces lactucae-debilis TaxID=2754530 RepID=A0A1Y2EXP7_PROLT|nr:uncharacterized protein BCR37DRAFT_383423 [Protomyces lactucae-debilis]ORY76348.1 hypothetical protein BCR37DRAFT_383423 [Protomyces lactucae-debilis]
MGFLEFLSRKTQHRASATITAPGRRRGRSGHETGALQRQGTAESETETATRDGLSEYFDAFEADLAGATAAVPPMTRTTEQQQQQRHAIGRVGREDTASTDSARSQETCMTLNGSMLRRAGRADGEQILLAWLSCQVYLTRQEYAARQTVHREQARFVRPMDGQGHACVSRGILGDADGERVTGIRYETCSAVAMARPMGLLLCQEEDEGGWTRTQPGCDPELDWAELQRGYRRSLQSRAKRRR